MEILFPIMRQVSVEFFLLFIVSGLDDPTIRNSIPPDLFCNVLYENVNT